jgi:hypothetical protein
VILLVEIINEAWRGLTLDFLGLDLIYFVYNFFFFGYSICAINMKDQFDFSTDVTICTCM